MGEKSREGSLVDEGSLGEAESSGSGLGRDKRLSEMEGGQEGEEEEGAGHRLGCGGGVGGKGSLDGDQGQEYQRDEEGPDGYLKCDACGKWVGVCFDTLLKNIYLGS